jgi:hypothetical protein
MGTLFKGERVVVKGGQENIVALQIDVSNGNGLVVQKSRENDISWGGWGLLAGGVAFVGVGSTYSLGILNLKKAYVNDLLNDQNLALSLYGAGAALLLGSLIVFAWTMTQNPPPLSARGTT